MKIKNITWSFMIALTAVGSGFTSCADQPDKFELASGTPTVYYIRPVDVASKDSLLTSASLQSTICLVGDNLKSIKGILFNDQAAVLNTSYITDHTLIVSVPNEIPSVVTDKMYMITASNDTIPYDFQVTISAPSVVSMSNEWAKAGEEVTITGDYFLDYDNYPLEIKVGKDYTLPREAITSIEKTKITFTMPEDMPQHEEIVVSDKYGSTNAPFQYMDNRGMLFDFDTPNSVTNEVLGNSGWHDRIIQSDDTSLSGNYMQIGNTGVTMAANGKWNDEFSFEYWAGNWANPETYASHPRLCDVADFSDWTNKSLKFEMLIPADAGWGAGPMQIIFGSPSQISLGNAGVVDVNGVTLAGCNNTWFHAQNGWGRAIYMPWYSNSSASLYDTGDKWVTVTIPLSDFNLEFDGNSATKSFSSINDFSSLNIFLIKGAYNDKSVLPDGVECTPIIKIDNIRVVPNK